MGGLKKAAVVVRGVLPSNAATTCCRSAEGATLVAVTVAGAEQHDPACPGGQGETLGPDSAARVGIGVLATAGSWWLRAVIGPATCAWPRRM